MKSITEIMNKDYHAVSPEANVLDTVKFMRQENTGAILVVDEKKLAGVFTERDIQNKFLCEIDSIDYKEARVRDYMTTDLELGSPKMTSYEVIALMREKHIRHMPIVSDGAVQGVVSLRRLAAQYQDELEALNESLKETQHQLVHASRVAAMGEMSAGVAHELNQPLMALSTHMETLSMNEAITSSEKLTAKMKKVKDQFSRLKSIVQRLSNFSKQRNEEKALGDVNAPIQDSLFLFAQQFKDHNIDIDMQLEDALPQVYFDRYQIQDIVINFLVNSRDAIDDIFQREVGGRVIIYSRKILNDQAVAVGIIDNGKPVTPGTEEKIFNAFFTTKGPEKGTGLGLSVCSNIINDHNGYLNFLVFDDSSKSFYFVLPIDKDKSLSDRSCVKEVEGSLKSFYQSLDV